MKHKTAELEGSLLDLAVGKAEGLPIHPGPRDFIVAHKLETVYAHERFFSRDWAYGGPIIERERISLDGDYTEGTIWCARTPGGRWFEGRPLIAAMRAYVASKLGEEIELP